MKLSGSRAPALAALPVVACHAGIFPIMCSTRSHLPVVSGQLVVLPAAAMAGAQ